MNKLYHILWTNSSGDQQETHIALPDEAEQPVSTQEVKYWLGAYVVQCDIGSLDAEVYVQDIFECTGVQDLNGDWYAVHLELLEKRPKK
jgi:hypothetical protein